MSHAKYIERLSLKALRLAQSDCEGTIRELKNQPRMKGADWFAKAWCEKRIRAIAKRIQELS